MFLGSRLEDKIFYTEWRQALRDFTLPPSLTLKHSVW